MADLMGSGGLAWHQWQKHGRCTGLDPEDYFALSRQAFGTVILPELEPGRLTAEELEEAILALNPDLGPDGLIVTCHEGLVQEVRICLDRDLEPRDCLLEPHHPPFPCTSAAACHCALSVRVAG